MSKKLNKSLKKKIMIVSSSSLTNSSNRRAKQKIEYIKEKVRKSLKPKTLKPKTLKPKTLKPKTLKKRKLIILSSSTSNNKTNPGEQKEEVKKRYNEEFIDIMEKLASIMLKQGEPFRARAYQKAQETIMSFPDDITDVEQLKGKSGIGETIIKKLNEYISTGTLKVLEREKNNPVNILGEIYGIGPKKAKELVKAGITSIEDLRSKQNEVLNDTQKVGLKYYEDVLKRIPRSEIEKYKTIFESTFDKVKTSTSAFEIVGSYRRGQESSGDIDVIITSESPEVFIKFIDAFLL